MLGKLLLDVFKLNKNRLFHADIKLDNLLYNSKLNNGNGEFSLIDFGLLIQLSNDAFHINSINSDDNSDIKQFENGNRLGTALWPYYQPIDFLYVHFYFV